MIYCPPTNNSWLFLRQSQPAIILISRLVLSRAERCWRLLAYLLLAYLWEFFRLIPGSRRHPVTNVIAQLRFVEFRTSIPQWNRTSVAREISQNLPVTNDIITFEFDRRAPSAQRNALLAGTRSFEFSNIIFIFFLSPVRISFASYPFLRDFFFFFFFCPRKAND